MLENKHITTLKAGASQIMIAFEMMVLTKLVSTMEIMVIA